MRHFLSIFLASVLLATAGAAQASVITYNVSLSGLNENPQNASPATGSATVVIDDGADTMTLHVVFSGLTGGTTAAHIHCCTPVPPLGNIGVATTVPTFALFPSGVTSGVYDAVLNLRLASTYNPVFMAANGGNPDSAEDALLAGIALGNSYLNIHTSTFPGGEIRGILVAAVPEPGNLALLALGGAMILASRRRQRRT
jgi:hypothetical protein